MGFMDTPKAVVKQESKNHLESLLDYYSDSYYRDSISEISDEEFDDLKEQYKTETGKEYNKVGGCLSRKLKKESHLHQMLSLEKVNDLETLKKWIHRVRDLTVNYVIDYKLDGVSLSLVYVYGHLLKAVTRGDGKEGENVTHNIQYVRNIPTFVEAFNKDSYIEVRGEVVISKSNFEVMKKQNAEFISARNLASGSIRVKNTEAAKNRNLDFLAYYIYKETGLLCSICEMMEFLGCVGFETPKFMTASNFDELVSCVNWLEKGIDEYPYTVDGLVIKIHEKDIIEKLGCTSHHPKGMVAYKFKADEAWTKLVGVEWQTSATGRINPVGIVEPVFLADANIEKVSLHNLEIIENFKLCYNDEVLIIRANDVIPYMKSKKQMNNGDPIKVPTTCPVCGSGVSRSDKFLYCTNEKCPGVLKFKVLKFLDILDIKGVGEAIAENIVEYLKECVDESYDNSDYYNVLNFTQNEWIQVCNSEVIGEKIRNQTFELINKGISPEKALAALLIDNVGPNIAEKILAYFTFSDLKLMTYYDYINIDGIGQVLAKNLSTIGQNKAYLYLVNLVKNEPKPSPFSNKLKNAAFCVTGVLPISRGACEELIKKNGGRIKSVSKELNYLVVGEKAGNKLDKAKNLNIECISYERLLEID